MNTNLQIRDSRQRWIPNLPKREMIIRFLLLLCGCTKVTYRIIIIGDWISCQTTI